MKLLGIYKIRASCQTEFITQALKIKRQRKKKLWKNCWANITSFVKGLNPGVISKVGWVWSSGWTQSWIGLLLLTVTDVSTTCGVVIFRVKVSCTTSEKQKMFNPIYSSLSLSIRASFRVTNTFFKFSTDIFMFHLIWWQLPQLEIWWNSWYWAPKFNFRNLLCRGIVLQNATAITVDLQNVSFP